MSLPLAIAVAQRARPAAPGQRQRAALPPQLHRVAGRHAAAARARATGSRSSTSTTPPLAVLGVERQPLLGRSLDEVLDTAERWTRSAAACSPASLDGWTAQIGRRRTGPGARVNVALSLLSGGPDPVFAAQLLDVTAEYAGPRPLEAAEKLTNATLDTTACIIMVTDLEGTVVRVNAAATALTGYAEDELLGRTGVGDRASRPPTARRTPQALFAWPTGRPITVVRESDATTRGRGEAADRLEQQHRPRRARPPDVRRDDRHRRHRRAHRRRPDDPPAAGGDHHRDHRHRHRAAGSRSSTPAPSTCSATTADDMVGGPFDRPARPRRAARAAPAPTSRPSGVRRR